MREIKYYKINIVGFPFEEIASYNVSIIIMFLFAILIIHANKILVILNEFLLLVLIYAQNKFNIELDKGEVKKE